MKKFLKILAIIVVVILVIAFTAPLLLRGKIAEIVKREANEMLTAKVDFNKLDISLLRHFPHASVDLKGLTVVGVEPFEGDTIVAADRISVVVNLMSLFGDSGYEVTKVILQSASVHASKLADGRVNWDIVKASEEKPSEKESSDEPSSFRLQVKDFRINDASIRYEDDSTGMRFATSPLSLRLKGDMSADETDLDLQLNAGGLHFVSGGIPMLSNAEAELNAVIAADLKNNKYTLSKTLLRLNAIELSVDGWVQMTGDAIAMDLKAGTDKVLFKDVLSLIPAFYTRDFRNLSASGELSMAVWAKGEMKGTTLPAFELKTDVKNGSFQYSSLPKAVDNINIAARIANPGGVMDKTEVDLSKLTLRMAGNSLSASLYATNLVSDPIFKAAADGKVDLGAIKEIYPLDKSISLNGLITADVKASGRMSAIEKARYEQISASGKFTVEKLDLTMPSLPAVQIQRAAANITPSAMTLGEFGVTVGSSDLSATGQLTNYLGYLLRGDKLSGRLYVKSNLLDLNEIMGAMPASEETSKTESTEPMAAIEVPKNLDLSLNTKLKKVLFQKMNIADVDGEVRMAGGVLSLNRLGMQLFGGQAMASGSYSTAANPQRPDLKLNVSLAGASFVTTFNELDMIQKLVPIFAKTGGDYSLSLDMGLALDNQMSPDLQSVNGNGEIKSANINIQNIEAFDALATALKNDKLRKIEAKNVDIKFAIKDGRITTQPFDLNVANTKINMSGSTGLDQTIDYTAKVTLPEGSTSGILQTVNVNIGGTFTSPKITLGVKEAAQEAVKNVIDQQVQKLTGSESLSAEIEKQAENLRAQAKSAGEKLVAAAQEQSDKLVAAAAEKGTLAKLAAEKAGEKLVSEAQKQADKLSAAAEEQIQKLTAKDKTE